MCHVHVWKGKNGETRTLLKRQKSCWLNQPKTPNQKKNHSTATKTTGTQHWRSTTRMRQDNISVDHCVLRSCCFEWNNGCGWQSVNVHMSKSRTTLKITHNSEVFWPRTYTTVNVIETLRETVYLYAVPGAKNDICIRRLRMGFFSITISINENISEIFTENDYGFN